MTARPPPCPDPGPTHARAALVLVLGLALAGTAAWAESDRSSASRFFHQEFERAVGPPATGTSPVPRAPPRAQPRFGRAVRFAPNVEARRPPPAAVVSRVAPSPPRATVAVFGDRMGEALARGLDAGGAVAVSADTQDGPGLTRADFTDWLRVVRARIGRPDHAAVGIVSTGSDDRGAIPDADGTAEPGTARWRELYEARFDAVAAAFRDARVPLIWVGLPAVKDDDASADFVRLNGILRDRAAKDGVTFVDSWDAFIDDAGQYSATGPDVSGTIAKLRRSDGVGFTRAGALKLASFVEADIKRLQAAPPPATQLADLPIDKPGEFDAALSIDINAQIRREAGLDGGPDPSAATPGGPLPRTEGAAPSDAAGMPVAGPVLALTAPTSSPGGRLASVGDSLAVTPEASAAPVPASDPMATARPGRADDFHWPRP